ncbi:MAG: hypothetical protein LBV27_05590 [Oscillospiraceae bacterium]|jgi:hypothetical protein|nr:hypothetical protein [Oscillospiraceae bacterium]
MGKSYFKIMFTIFFAALTVCGVMRIILRLSLIDPATGFYTATAGIIPTVFNIIFGAALVALLILNRLRRGNNDYPVHRRGRALPILAIAAGLSMLAFAWLGLPDHFGQSGVRSEGWATFVLVFNYAFTTVSGLIMVYAGVHGFVSEKQPSALLLIIPPIWQLVLLLSRFNGYFSILYISDNLLIILFMAFATLFYIGHARTLCGFGRKDGRNYVISAGLGTALCGFLSSIPNFIYMIARQAPIPVDEISTFECLYTLVLSVYALAFVASYAKSIDYV